MEEEKVFTNGSNRSIETISKDFDYKLFTFVPNIIVE